MKVFEMWQVGSWFSFEQKAVVFCQVMQIPKNILVMTSSRRQKYPYDIYQWVVINSAKFDACTFRSFRGVKTDTQTDSIALYT